MANDRLRRLLRENVDPGRVQSRANTVVAAARDLTKGTDTPLSTYAQAGNLLATLGTMFHAAGDQKLAATLTRLAGAVHKRGEAFRHTNDWETA